MNHIKLLSAIILALIFILIIYTIFESINNFKYSKKDTADLRAFDIIELKELNYSTINNFGFSTSFMVFIVQNMNNTDNLGYKIDSFICNLSIDQKINSTVICFYKETELTNSEYLKRNPRELVRNSEQDLLVCYYWDKGKFDRKHKYFDIIRHEREFAKFEILDSVDCLK